MNITTGAVSTDDVLKFAAELEAAIGEVANRERKADRLPLEPMARLIQFARDGAAEIERLRAWIKAEGENSDICTRNVLGVVCTHCRCGKA